MSVLNINLLKMRWFFFRVEKNAIFGSRTQAVFLDISHVYQLSCRTHIPHQEFFWTHITPLLFFCVFWFSSEKAPNTTPKNARFLWHEIRVSRALAPAKSICMPIAPQIPCLASTSASQKQAASINRRGNRPNPTSGYFIAVVVAIQQRRQSTRVKLAYKTVLFRRTAAERSHIVRSS